MIESTPRTRSRRASLVLIGLVIIGGVGCADDTQGPNDIFATSCTVSPPDVSGCDSCITLTPVARLGSDWDGPGFLTNDGTMEFVVRDGIGSFWVGQQGEVKRYGSDGKYLGSIGRPGEGPMEFRRPRPMHVDRLGRIHVIDSGQGRISVVDQRSLDLIHEISIPRVVVNSAVAVDDGRRYAIQAWIPTAERIGLPIHIVDRQGLVGSFGIDQSATGHQGAAYTSSNTERRLTMDNERGIVYSVYRRQYRVEGWSLDGQPVAAVNVLEDLNSSNDPDEIVSPDNPLPQVVLQVHFDAKRLLWVMLALRSDDWLEHMTEVVGNDGITYFAPSGGRNGIFDIYQSRLDVIDLEQCAAVASTEVDGFLGTFLADGMVSTVDVVDGLGDVLDIWKVSLDR